MIAFIVFLIVFPIRIICAVLCYRKARELNREKNAWALFGFFMPIVATIWVYCSKPLHYD